MEYKFTTAAKKCSLCKKIYEELEYYYSILTFEDNNLSDDDKTKQDEKTKKEDKTKKDEKKKKEEFALELARLDVCQSCWEKTPHDKNFSWWRMQKAVKPKLPALKDADFLWQLFAQAQTILENIPSTSELESSQHDETSMHANPESDVPEKPILSEDFSQKITEAEHFVYVSSLGLLRLKQIKLKGYKKIEQDDYLVFTFPNSKREVVIRDPKLSPATLKKLEVTIEKLSESKHKAECN